jgi:hypothetical protein
MTLSKRTSMLRKAPMGFLLNLTKYLAKVYLAKPHSPFEGRFTLFTLSFILFKGESPFSKGEWISAVNFHPKINTKNVLGNDILYGE